LLECSGKHLRLRVVRPNDARFILGLRLDERLNRFVSKVDSDIQKQIEWINEYKVRERHGSEYYFIVEDKAGEAQGTVRLYDFIEDSFCWGSWVMKKEAPSYAAIESALLVYEFAFYQLGFMKSHFDVRKENARVVDFHKRFGAEIIDEDEANYYFTFDRASYESIRKRYARFLG